MQMQIVDIKHTVKFSSPLTCTGSFTAACAPLLVGMAETFSLFWEGGERPGFPASLDCLNLGEVEEDAPPEGRLSWEEPGVGIPEGPGIRDTPGLLLPANTYMCMYERKSLI